MVRDRRKIEPFEVTRVCVEQATGCTLITTEEEYNRDLLGNKTVPSKIELQFICSICKKNTFKTTMRRFNERGKAWCYECSMKQRGESFEEVRYYVESFNGCKLLSDTYIDCLSPLIIKCWCGREFETSYAQFKNGNKTNCGTHSISKGKVL